jgi:hypothetical protein
MNEVLERLGSQKTNWHISRDEYSDYGSGSIAEHRSRPENFRVVASFLDTFSRIPPGCHALSHLPPDGDIVHTVSDFEVKVFFLFRDLRDCAISYMRFLADTGRDRSWESEWFQAPDGPERALRFLEVYSWLFSTAARIVEWHKHYFALPVRYETLVGDHGPQAQTDLVARICRHLQVERSPQELENTIRTPVATATLTSSGQRTRRARYWSDLVQKRFEEFGGAKLNDVLGYSSD